MWQDIAERWCLAVSDDELFEGMPECRDIEVLENGGQVCVLVGGQMYMSWKSGDEESRRMAIAQLYECGRGSRAQLAEAFGVHVNSVHNYITNFARDGFRGIATQRRGPRGGWKLTPRRRSKILAVAFQDGVGSIESVQKRLRERWHEEISLPSIRQVLEENGLLDAESLNGRDQYEQGELFDFQADRQLELELGLSEYTGTWFADDETIGEEQSPVPDSVTDTVGFPQRRSCYSSAQRVYVDLLEQGDYNAYVGGLLFVPLLEQYEFLPTLKRVIDGASPNRLDNFRGRIS